MATRYFDLSNLFAATFGYQSAAFEPDFEPVSGNSAPDRATTGAYGTPYYGIDAMNREYYLPVALTYMDNRRLTTWQLPHPVVAIRSKKNIVETPLTERAGTVLELVNTEHYSITIKGLIVANQNELPEDEVTRLRKVYESNEPIAIKCALTDIFLVRPERAGSDQVLIKELNIPPVMGIKNVRPYELALVSVEPFDLKTIS
jgi:hypothetical protein